MQHNKNMKNKIKKFFTMKQEGLGVIEIILIIVVLIALVLIFKDSIKTLIASIMTKINGEVDAM
ncbi:MAG TPA: Flp1 family type IVb pilin [Mobilitalea sp.]|nr:Flp1 family type IVb pilin [Mobilitalea sp.]